MKDIMTGTNFIPIIRIFYYYFRLVPIAAYSFIDIRLNDMKQNDFEEDKPKIHLEVNVEKVRTNRITILPKKSAEGEQQLRIKRF